MQVQVQVHVRQESSESACVPNVNQMLRVDIFFMPHYELKAKLWRASNVNENTSFHMKTAIGSASFNQKHLWIFKKELIPQASSESSPLIIEDTLALTSVTIHMVKQLLQFDQHVLKPIYHVVQPFTIRIEKSANVKRHEKKIRDVFFLCNMNEADIRKRIC